MNVYVYVCAWFVRVYFSLCRFQYDGVFYFFLYLMLIFV